MNRTHQRYVLVSLVFVPWLFLSACASFGAKRISRDRFDYNAAIGRSANEQMLLNLVRLRYHDVPVHLAIASVFTQYFYIGRLGVSGSTGSELGEPLYRVGGDANIAYAERPTITYSPLTGEEFRRQMLRPILPDMLFYFIQSGWPSDQLLIMGLERLNHVENFPFVGVPSPKGIERLQTFQRVVRLIVELGKLRAIEMQVDGDTRYLVFEETQDPATQALIDELKSAVGLDPKRSVFRVTRRSVRRKPDEVTVRMRSVLTLMGFLSRGVEIPAVHVMGKRVAETDFLTEETRSLLFPLRIHSQADRPENAFVAVRYQDHWFYVRHDDHRSKQAFSLLTYLFQLQAPQAPTAGPVLTVPTGP